MLLALRGSTLTWLICCAALLALVGGCAQPPPTAGSATVGESSNGSIREIADMVLRNGNIITVDDDLGTVEALAIRDGLILAVGSNEEMTELVGADTDVIDLDGKTALPGFIEGHGHFTGIGVALQNLDLTQVRNWDEVVRMVQAAVAKSRPGEWILGRGWHQEKWDRSPEDAVGGFPAHHSVSAVSPDNPVSFTHASGHAAFFNQKAMALAGVDAKTADPPGGEILRDSSGSPIGVFVETAQGLVSRVRGREQSRRTAAQVRDDLREAIRLADRECLSNGITSFQDAGSPLSTIDVIREMAEAGEIGTRLWVMIRDSNQRLAANIDSYEMVGVGNQHLTVKAIKRTIDGALGSRGAWLLAPYEDSPSSTGLNTATIEDVTETARIAAKHGFQLCVHAIGDRANREVLDIFEKTFEANPGMTDHRWRVEHAQHLNPDDIPRFAKLGVVASMQGVHCTSDAPWVIARLGEERAEQGAYVWQKLMQSGALVTNGTDAPVEDVSPIASYYATVSRRLRDGSVFYEDQRMSRMEALKSYTINCAKAAFEEDIKGSLRPGKLADVVVLSADITRIPEEEIPRTEVITTIVGGQVRYAQER